MRIRAYSTKLPFKEVIILSAPREAGTVHVLNIRVPEGNAPTYERNVKRLQVLWNNRTWLNFGSYLEFSTNVKFDPNYKETDVYRKTIGGHGSAALFNWYQATRKPFRFMDLPVELLLQVYSYCIGNDVCPKVITVNEKPAVGIGRGWVPSPPMSPELDSTYDLSEVVAAPNAAILSLSKNDREEALDAVWMSTRLCFAGPRSLEKMTTAPLSLPTYALKKIGLNFLSLNYIEFFGAEITFNPFLYILTINIDRE